MRAYRARVVGPAGKTYREVEARRQTRRRREERIFERGAALDAYYAGGELVLGNQSEPLPKPALARAPSNTIPARAWVAA